MTQNLLNSLWKHCLICFLFLFSFGSSVVYGFERGPLFTVDNESVCKTDPQSACEYLVTTKVTDVSEILDISVVAGDSALEGYPQTVPTTGSSWSGWTVNGVETLYPTVELACGAPERLQITVGNPSEWTFDHSIQVNPSVYNCYARRLSDGAVFFASNTVIRDGCPDNYQDDGNGTCVLQGTSGPASVYQCQAQIVSESTMSVVDLTDIGSIYPICNPGDPVSTITNEAVCNSSDNIPDKGANLGGEECPNLEGNPINSATGNKFALETDIVLSSGLIFSRSYNSQSLSGSTQIGSAWLHTYQRSLYVNPETVTATRSDGRQAYFHLSGPAWINQQAGGDTLIQVTDANDDPIGWQFITANDDVENYNLEGRLLTISARDGRVQTLTYDPDGRMISVSDDVGRNLMFAYDSLSRIATITDPAGGLYQYNYDGVGNLTSVTYPDNKVRIYHYNEPAYTSNTDLPNALTGITDENGIRYATYTYDTQGRAFITEHAGGADKHTLTYSTDGSNTITTDPLGSNYTRQFQTILGVAKSISQSQPAGAGCSAASSATTYDVNGNVASRTDFNGNKACFAFDLNRNLEVARVEGLAAGSVCPSDLVNYTPTANSSERKTLTSWHVDFRLPTLVTEAQRETSFNYDTYGNVTLLSIRDTASNETRTWNTGYIYHPTVPGVITQRIEDGPRTDVSDITTINYYAPDENCTGGHMGCRGQVASITNALGHVTHITRYNAHGQPEVVTDPNGLTTTLAYDTRQRLVSRIVGTETTDYQYDSVGQVTRITFPDNSFLAYTYDDAHRLTEIVDSLNNRIQYTLDAMGNRTQEEIFDPTNTLAETRSQEFDALSRLWKSIGAQSQTTEFGYDANGNLKQATNPLQHTTTNSFDALDRLMQSTDPLNGQAQQTQDALDQVTQVIDPKGIATTYTYNGLGDLLQEVSADRGTTVYTYDAAGNQITRTDARGVVETTTYDALNRQTGRTYVTVTGVPNIDPITWSYDAGSNGIGRLAGMTDESGSTAYSYDLHGRLLNKIQTVKFGTRTFTQTLSYQYDSSGRLSQTTYPSGTQISTLYGVDGRPSEIRVNGTALIQNITYQPFGAVKGWTWGNGQVHNRSFDLDGRITQHPIGSDTRTLTYDAASQIIQTSDTNPAYNRGYSYDELGRLIGRSDNTSFRLWTYDANSNRTSVQSGSNLYPYTVDTNSNRLMSVAGPVAKTYTYDATGNVLSDGITNFTWNAAGRLRKIVKGNKTRKYKFNGLGERTRRNGADKKRFAFLYDAAGHLVSEYKTRNIKKENWKLKQETVWLDDIPIAVLKQPVATEPVQVYFIHTDHLNTPRLIVDKNNTPVWRWNNSEAFGANLVDKDPDGDGTKFQYNLRFAGQYFDNETRLHYNYFRNYDPETGRYISSDPIGLAGGLNTYGYVLNNPLGYIDPTGETSVIVIGGIIIASFGIVTSAKKCSSGIDNVSKGFKAGNKLNAARQELADCIFDPLCDAAKAQALADTISNADQEFRSHTVQAIENLGTSVPGTTVTGPIPTNVSEAAAGTITNTVTSK
jgi:RHS repeat-associated protein